VDRGGRVDFSRPIQRLTGTEALDLLRPQPASPAPAAPQQPVPAPGWWQRLATDHDRALSVYGTAFEPESGLTASEVRSGSDLSVDAQDAQGVLSSDRITETDILDGRWDNAAVELWRVNWTATSQRVLLRRGAIAFPFSLLSRTPIPIEACPHETPRCSVQSRSGRRRATQLPSHLEHIFEGRPSARPWVRQAAETSSRSRQAILR
jgi:hypothetical protein